MSKRKKIERIAVIREEMRVYVDAAEAEKRGLTDEEQTAFNSLKNERSLLQLQLERDALGSVGDGYDGEETRERSFATVVSSICQRRSLDERYEGFADNTSIDIPRTRSIQNMGTIKDSLVPLTIGEIIQPLEKGLILSKVGSRMQYGLVGDFILPVVASVEASIEEENAVVADKKIEVKNLKSNPKRVSITIPVSNTAIDQSNDTLLDIVRTQMIASITRILNKWMFGATKITTTASDGVFVKDTPNLIYDTSLSYADVIALKGAVLKAGVVVDETAAYVCSAETYAQLESTPRTVGDSRMILEDGKINGFPVYATEYAGSDMLGFGVFSYVLVGQFGKMRMIVNPYTGDSSNTTRFTINTSFDIITMRKEAFAVAKKKVVVPA